MDVESLLQEKLKKLEELKRQRSIKQKELISQFSSDTHNNNNDNKDHGDENDSVNTVSEEIIEFKDPILSEVHYSGTINDENVSPISQPPKIMYTKTIDTSDLEYIASPSDPEITKAQLEKDLERKIRAELEKKYKEKYNDALNSLIYSSSPLKDSSGSNKVDEPEEYSQHLEYPKTKIKQIFICETDENKFLTLHDDYICLWCIDRSTYFTLTRQISLYTQINTAIFDSGNTDKIIAGSESGYIFIFDLLENTQFRSKIQINPIISICQSSNSLIILTVDGDYILMATNLIDILDPLTNIFKTYEINSNNPFVLDIERITITTCKYINANNAIVGLIAGEVLLVDFGLKKITVIYAGSDDKLPNINIAYNNGKILILNLDNSIKVYNVTGNNIVEGIDLPNLSFSVEWLTSSTFVTCSIRNEVHLWKLQDDKIKRFKKLNFETNKEMAFISCIKLLNNSTLILGDLNGKVYSLNVN